MGGDSFSSGAFNDPKHVVSGSGLERTIYSSSIGAAAGIFYGGCAAAWFPDPVESVSKFGGASGRTSFRALGQTVLRPAMWFSFAAGAFTATECAMEAARNETKDVWNTLAAGMVGGAVVGLTNGRPQVVAATAIATGIFMVALDLTGDKTVFDEKALDHKRMGLLPETHKESAALSALKSQYPQHKNL
mmetsp:Transcript_7910/g.11951  ORF Transcript_7910/g.11951 Transcript_7910/m.11951 type:complete len:189 (+) Transcript_7910:42-608(+)|eukprot:scaffold13384_cov114-Skeletonema_dohrnii-CCMP3373.AAC.1